MQTGAPGRNRLELAGSDPNWFARTRARMKQTRVNRSDSSRLRPRPSSAAPASTSPANASPAAVRGGCISTASMWGVVWYRGRAPPSTESRRRARAVIGTEAELAGDDRTSTAEGDRSGRLTVSRGWCSRRAEVRGAAATEIKRAAACGGGARAGWRARARGGCDVRRRRCAGATAAGAGGCEGCGGAATGRRCGAAAGEGCSGGRGRRRRAWARVRRKSDPTGPEEQ